MRSYLLKHLRRYYVLMHVQSCERNFYENVLFNRWYLKRVLAFGRSLTVFLLFESPTPIHAYYTHIYIYIYIYIYILMHVQSCKRNFYENVLFNRWYLRRVLAFGRSLTVFLLFKSLTPIHVYYTHGCVLPLYSIFISDYLQILRHFIMHRKWVDIEKLMKAYMMLYVTLFFFINFF